VSQLKRYRYHVTALIGLVVVFFLYIFQPKQHNMAHGIVWPDKGQTMNLSANLQSNPIDVLSKDEFSKLSGATRIGEASVFLHDDANCYTKSDLLKPNSSTEKCKKHLMRSYEEILTKAKQLASQLNNAKYITSVAIQPPRYDQPAYFQQWVCKFNIYPATIGARHE
jgi:hypothetical protein